MLKRSSSSSSVMRLAKPDCAAVSAPERHLQLEAGPSAKQRLPDDRVRQLDGVLRSPGMPIPSTKREAFDSRLGNDFSRVRVHTDAAAAASARAFGARAFTTGQHIVFAAGQYDPDSGHGRRLLAHELTHVTQQASGPVSGKSVERGIEVSSPEDSFEVEARQVSEAFSTKAPGPARIGRDATPTTRGTVVLQRVGSDSDPGAPPSETARQPAPKPNLTDAPSGPAAIPGRFPAIGLAVEMPLAEAARRVDDALDAMTGLTYVQRPGSAEQVASVEDERAPTSVQLAPDSAAHSATASASPLARVHGGTVGSMQLCWDCLTGEASLRGWLWAGVGYDVPRIGWVGGYYFGEKVWWKGQLQKLFEPGTCDPACDPNRDKDSTTGFGIAGFPIDIRPRQRVRFGKAGLEAGFLLSPRSFCDADLELIALVNLLGYLGPVATIATKATDGINKVTKDSPHVSLEAGLDASASFHLCRGANSLLAINHADFCAGGFVGGGVGLSHTKSDNHGAA